MLPRSDRLTSLTTTLSAILACLALLGRGPCHAQATPATEGDLKEQCAAAYERTQRARHEGKLLEAQERAVFCGQDRCPEVLRGDCITWARELSLSVPSVVLDVRHDDGSEVLGLHVEVDGRSLSTEQLGRALALDPGVHDFVFRDAEGQVQRATRSLAEGQQRETVRVRFARAPVVAERAALPDLRARRVALRALLGTALLAAGGFAGFAIHGKRRESELEEDCAPECNRARATAISRDYLFADMFMGVSAATLAAAFGVYLSGGRLRAPQSVAAQPPVRLSAGRGGAGVGLSVGF